MKEERSNIANKMNELERELKSTGLWQKQTPGWVNAFEEKMMVSGEDFAEWLQFVFIPNHQQDMAYAGMQEKKFIGPAAVKFYGQDVQKGNLLQVLIEIDSLL